MMKKINIILAVLALLISLFVLIFTSCFTGQKYSKYEYQECPDCTKDCVVTINIAKAVEKGVDKSVLMYSVEKCHNSNLILIKLENVERCKKRVFLDGSVDYNDLIKINNYKQCLDEIK